MKLKSTHRLSRFSWKYCLGLLCLVTGLVVGTVPQAFAQSATGTATITGSASQTVKGWGCFPSYFRTDWSPSHLDDMFDKPAMQNAVFNLGITHFRVDLESRLYVSGTSVSNIVLSGSALSDLVNQIKIGINHGVTNYIMSCWSPPAVWKDTGTVNGGHLIAADEPYYVNYYIAVLKALQAAGVGLPVGISVQNEPDVSNTTYDTCIYTDSGAGWALWRQLVPDMRSALNANGMSSVTVFGPECAATDNDINLLGQTFGMMSTAPFDTSLGAYASHTYGENIWLELRSGMKQYPLDAWITEWCVDLNSDDGGTENGWTLDTMAHMASNFVDIPYNYWTWWMGWEDSASAPPGTVLITGTQSTPIYSERYWVMQKLWTTVRPGWAVHTMTCSSSNFITINTKQNTWETKVDLVSFWDAANDASVTMLVNSTGTSTTMTVNGLVGTSYQAFQSNATENMVNVGSGAVLGSSASVVLSASSVTLLMTTSTTCAAPDGLVALENNPGVSLAWPAVWGATSYNIGRATVEGGPYTTIETAGVGGLPSCSDTTAASGTTYYYVVSAVNASGTGANSSPVSISVPYAITPVADAYVRDGTYANTNFGTATDLESKQDVTGYNRQSYLRFNVSGLATAQSVKLWLMPISAANDDYFTNLAVEYVANDTWSQSGSSGITWNNKPAGSGTYFVSGTGYDPGSPVEIDVTSMAVAKAAQDGYLSIHISSPVQDANGEVSFASTNNGNASYYPVLLCRMQANTREPLANAYVRDGTYATTNFGGSTDLSVKLDGTGYQRESFLQFDVSGLANVPSVKLMLVPDTVGTDGSTVNCSYEFVPDNNWTEYGITWNTKPASTTVLGALTGYAAGQPVEIDVTNQAHIEAAATGLLSIRIRSTILDSNGWVNFYSRENSNASCHPVLVY